MRRDYRTLTIYLLVLTSLALAAGFLAGFLFHDLQYRHQAAWPLLEEVYALLDTRGLKPLPTAAAVEYGLIRGLVEAYDDPYTTFVEPARHELDSNTLSGRFGGIGIGLGRGAENQILLYPFPDGPADAAGVLEGDQLIQVDDLAVTPLSTDETLQAAIRGLEGTRVRITVLRPPDLETIEFSIVRAEIPLPSVTWRLDGIEPRLGVLEVNVIAASTVDEIITGVADLKNRGAQAYLLDLRDNFGGLLTAGADVARLFLSEGVILEQQYRDKDIETYRVQRPGPLADIPLVVLVNQHTASAAEIIAGALQVQGRAALVGVPTFGKDTIQLVFDLQDGSSLHVTAARWWVPGLEPPIQGHGLIPDYEVTPQDDPAGPDLALQTAADLLFPAP